ncbi:hypothetical protein ACFX13_004932 [Malus domestica]|uniref:Uncharacterized protein n=1 Tax=Malus domestica TaxID=3750 RepID=A0A498IYE3_MALDO|nr:hypothetical protein DVH24_017344 [Malus domestica]
MMSAPCGTTVLYPDSGCYIHCFKALSPALSLTFFHLLTLQKMGDTALISGGVEELCGTEPFEVAWLEEFRPTEKFVVNRGRYKGSY